MHIVGLWFGLPPGQPAGWSIRDNAIIIINRAVVVSFMDIVLGLMKWFMCDPENF